VHQYFVIKWSYTECSVSLQPTEVLVFWHDCHRGSSVCPPLTASQPYKFTENGDSWYHCGQLNVVEVVDVVTFCVTCVALRPVHSNTVTLFDISLPICRLFLLQLWQASCTRLLLDDCTLAHRVWERSAIHSVHKLIASNRQWTANWNTWRSPYYWAYTWRSAL